MRRIITLLNESAPNGPRVELQQRPYSYLETIPGVQANRLTAITTEYAVIVWTPSGVIARILEADTFEDGNELLIAETKTRYNKDVLKYIPGRNRIVNGIVTNN